MGEYELILRKFLTNPKKFLGILWEECEKVSGNLEKMLENFEENLKKCFENFRKIEKKF